MQLFKGRIALSSVCLCKCDKISRLPISCVNYTCINQVSYIHIKLSDIYVKRYIYTSSFVLSGSVRHFDVALLWKFTLYGQTYGLHNNFGLGTEFLIRMKGKFWSILWLLFYLERMYLPTLQQARLWQLNYYMSLCF